MGPAKYEISVRSPRKGIPEEMRVKEETKKNGGGGVRSGNEKRREAKEGRRQERHRKDS